MTASISHCQPFSTVPHDALSGEAEAAATPDQAAKTVSATRSLRLSLDRRSTSGFGRSPQDPMDGPEQRKEVDMTNEQTALMELPESNSPRLTRMVEDNKFHRGAPDGKHYWLTPPSLFQKLAARFGFDFDPCPYPKPDDFDGLTCEWGKSSYVNPPFGSIIHQGKKKGMTAWVRKAIEENKKGKRVVMVYPIDKWVLMLMAAGAKVENLGDVRWHATEDGSEGKGMGRHIACFILEPAPTAERPVSQVDQSLLLLRQALLALAYVRDNETAMPQLRAHEQTTITSSYNALADHLFGPDAHEFEQSGQATKGSAQKEEA